MQTLYGEITDTAFNTMKTIKLLICDIDGVFSDGRIYLGNDGEELKAFHTKDGYGIKALGASGVDVAVITGRTSNIVATRMSALNVKYIVQGEENKLPALKTMAKQLKLSLEEIAYIGDDMPDYECIKAVGLGIAVQDAHPSILSIANYTTFNHGGFGAVREICDLIMLSQNTLANASGASI
ncbi:MAG: 3-deoxy-D-manno-octulosonate 8-phosphate phosphatase (KDO 8-P phosphatase) [Colwellia sp.]|jgi:3-deoxy-D-manno-octulosonate 8-phosphate phosphatase (KDO 8-P phosphatase)|uniref:3-deoxy-manno-octulosonate-8-phosphatase KdsC n=1 Tax=unclassified Colwellia TaxID=196834 RepID=UPI0015F75F68|nr:MULTISPECIES: 3-deoxy-manno-octulosonate-8-phosphatase KdsC [unclassified Colwellia]MBA6254116.1 3-deoxy-manno-octulosonate-8-phosphatase KdsC [Colwellia sp. MB3u-55]MBA6377576.1 3-deoxy-manno-octulosonate-8-phosphatase KdsC [Colwellia sp. BRX10-7]MBA6386448.1 3-deoxy-manno-octulosonate-8-phosphatase KdsC [Colwellia sp. BRX10-2]MBA6396169.1 3-deoxy-manno-octulosonate-8-phosphatase KdsC [Colwellia sp. BRX10-4]MBA6401716.1 3-deoxy-manno-octulosonate-8-phosphatase KdsC [Colwellia sp. BRX10-5]